MLLPSSPSLVQLSTLHLSYLQLPIHLVLPSAFKLPTALFLVATFLSFTCSAANLSPRLCRLPDLSNSPYRTCSASVPHKYELTPVSFSGTHEPPAPLGELHGLARHEAQVHRRPQPPRRVTPSWFRVATQQGSPPLHLFPGGISRHLPLSFLRLRSYTGREQSSRYPIHGRWIIVVHLVGVRLLLGSHCLGLLPHQWRLVQPCCMYHQASQFGSDR